jgi:hypothetical protein
LAKKALYVRPLEIEARIGDITTDKHRRMYPYLQYFSEGNPEAARCPFEARINKLVILIPFETDP